MRHRRSIGVRLIGLYLCALATWMQFLAPVAAMSMERSAGPYSIICAKGKAAAGQTTPDQNTPGNNSHTHHTCAHCLVCHASSSGMPGAAPAFTALDYPVASPLRWNRVRSEVGPRLLQRGPQPRGPPTLV